MGYQFEFYPYRRRFKHPLQTRYGVWEVREGIIVCLRNEERISWGEIAPISWFGSESLAEAQNFCCQLPPVVTEEMIWAISPRLPACQFGLASAWENLEQDVLPLTNATKVEFCGLLAAGKTALVEWQNLWQQGYRTFKWKIGVGAVEEELEIFTQLAEMLPVGARLRLDANGGLSYAEAKAWLRVCEQFPVVEFLEQPLPVSQLDAMVELNNSFTTELALDESVATPKQLQSAYEQGWRGIFVIKPCIFGFPADLRQFCRAYEIDTVFSSVFETEIGRSAALQIAAELSCNRRALGFGIQHWFAESIGDC